MNVNQNSKEENVQKRKRESNENIEELVLKKQKPCDGLQENHSIQNEEQISFKILIPSIAAGAVIGKDGKAIFQAQEESKTRVKMSKKNELYPGTTERVCIISGTREAVLKMNTYIMEKILEKPDSSSKTTSNDGKTVYARHKQVKILVPNSTAGMIIGKNGVYINEMKQKSGSYIQLSQKPPDFNLSERCIIVAGELDQNRLAIDMILAVISQDPLSGSCNQLTYYDSSVPIASVFPTGSPFAPVLNNTSTSPLSSTFPISLGPQFVSLSSNQYLVDQNLLQSSLNSLLPTTNSSVLSNMNQNSNMASIQSANLDYSQMASSLIGSNATTNQYPTLSNGTNILQSQNLPRVSTSVNPGFNRLGMNQSTIGSVHQTQQQSPQSYCDPSNIRSPLDSILTANFLNQALGTNLLNGSINRSVPTQSQLNQDLINLMTQSNNHPANPGSILSPLLAINPSDLAYGSMINNICCEKEIPIHESLVGIILGPQGQTIINLQSSTNTTIKISKKGVYRPGTQDRIVSITGLQPNVQKAVQLIDYNVKTEQLRRQGILAQNGKNDGT